MATDPPRLYVALYTDADVHGKLAGQIRARGFDAISADEVGNKGLDDLAQLEFATEQGRAVLTHNARDFDPLMEKYWNEGREHFGDEKMKFIKAKHAQVVAQTLNCPPVLPLQLARTVATRLSWIGDNSPPTSPQIWNWANNSREQETWKRQEYNLRAPWKRIPKTWKRGSGKVCAQTTLQRQQLVGRNLDLLLSR